MTIPERQTNGYKQGEKSTASPFQVKLRFARRENDLLEFRVVAERIQVNISLSTNTQIGLQIQSSAERFKGRVDRPQTRSCSCQAIMNVRGIWISFQRTFKKFLRGNILTSIKFDHSSVIKSIRITRRRKIATESGF